MTNHIINAICFFLFSFLQASMVYGQNAEQVLERYYKSVGGKEKWERVASAIEFYDIEEFVRHSSQATENMLNKENGLRIFKKKGHLYGWDRFITIPLFSIDSFTTCFNGEKYWAQSVKQSPEEYTSYKSTYEKYVTCGEPCLIMSADHSVYIERKDGIDALKISIGGSSYLYYFDVSTGYLIEYHKYPKIDGTTTCFKNYKDFGGYTVPTFEESYKKGILIRRLETKRLLVNIEISDRIFAYPKAPFNILEVPLGF